MSSGPMFTHLRSFPKDLAVGAYMVFVVLVVEELRQWLARRR